MTEIRDSEMTLRIQWPKHRNGEPVTDFRWAHLLRRIKLAVEEYAEWDWDGDIVFEIDVTTGVSERVEYSGGPATPSAPPNLSIGPLLDDLRPGEAADDA